MAKNTASNNQNLDEYDPFSSNTAPPTLQANQTLPAYSASGQQYQVNDNSTNNGSGGGGGVTQISTSELQVSHQFFRLAFPLSRFIFYGLLMCWNFAF